MRPLDRAAALSVAAALALTLGACRESAVPAGARRDTTTEVRELTPRPGELAMPVNDGSVRFAVIGDSGRGDQAQHEIARQMVAWRAKFPFDFVVMLGDNIYPPNTPHDYVTKFEEPYRALLDAGVTFHAAIGNHDPPDEIYLRKIQHGRTPVLHLPAQRAAARRARRGGRPVLRARQPRTRSRSARLAPVGAGQIGNGLEDLLFPPPDLHRRPLRLRRARRCAWRWSRSSSRATSTSS